MSQKILIVDDEILIQKALMDFFTDETDFIVKAALSGEEGLAILKTFKPTVCIVDMRLPGINGNEFITAANSILKECLFIIHTGSMGYKLPVELTRLGIGIDQVFEKPVPDMNVFLALIHKKDKESKES